MFYESSEKCKADHNDIPLHNHEGDQNRALDCQSQVLPDDIESHRHVSLVRT